MYAVEGSLYSSTVRLRETNNRSKICIAFILYTLSFHHACVAFMKVCVTVHAMPCEVFFNAVTHQVESVRREYVTKCSMALRVGLLFYNTEGVQELAEITAAILSTTSSFTGTLGLKYVSTVTFSSGTPAFPSPALNSSTMCAFPIK